MKNVLFSLLILAAFGCKKKYECVCVRTEKSGAVSETREPLEARSKDTYKADCEGGSTANETYTATCMLEP